ncbi:MAG: DUF1761 domain-containing protein [Pseudomonadota bacterium]
MEFGGINYLAVAAAGAAGFVTGAIWYTALGKAWMTAASLSEEDVKPKPILFITAAVCQLIIAWVLAGLVGHLGEGQVNLRNGLISAAFVWFGFVLTTQIVNHRFQGRPWSLTAIDCGHWLAVLLVQGAVIGLIGVRS